MPVYSVLSSKGGAGKTLTTVQLAIWLCNQNYSVAIIDNDKQRSIADWLEDHQASLTIVETDNHKEMEKAVYQLLNTHDVVLVDNAGGDVLSMSIVMQISDHILIPVQASAVDINSTMDTLEELNLARRRANKSIPATIFLNRVTKGSKIIKEVINVFGAVEGINFSSIQIPQTVRLAALSGDTESVFDKNSNADLATLFNRLFASTIRS
jgi:chromosome partitioning protein